MKGGVARSLSQSSSLSSLKPVTQRLLGVNSFCVPNDIIVLIKSLIILKST